jgi:uncharacterized protein YydD (DUF2326 family)
MSTRHIGIDFLVHDSILFADVDPRQRAHALERAAKMCKETDTQYICALNSDTIPYDDFTDGFNYRQFVRLELNDKDPSGSLLGIQFEKPRR